MNKPFKSIGIISRHSTPVIVETLESLWHFLDSLPQIEAVFVESDTAKALDNISPQLINKKQLSEKCELVIVIGGDGSMLHAAHTIADQNVQLIGINRGKLGFLTDINPIDIEKKLEDILSGNYIQEKRFLLSASLSHNPKQTFEALNEVAITAAPNMMEFEIYINNRFVCSHSADGLIIATPTGSTAYALSSGGPILHPELNACVLVPISSHSLTARPIAFNADEEVKIVLAKNTDITPQLSIDGVSHTINTGETITISKKDNPLNLIHPQDYNYYEALRSKLYWGKKLK